MTVAAFTDVDTKPSIDSFVRHFLMTSPRAFATWCLSVVCGLLLGTYCVNSFFCFLDARDAYADISGDREEVPAAVLIATILGFLTATAYMLVSCCLLFAISCLKLEAKFILFLYVATLATVVGVLAPCSVIMHFMDDVAEDSIGEFYDDDWEGSVMHTYRFTYVLGYWTSVEVLLYFVVLLMIREYLSGVEADREYPEGSLKTSLISDGIVEP